MSDWNPIFSDAATISFINESTRLANEALKNPRYIWSNREALEAMQRANHEELDIYSGRCVHFAFDDPMPEKSAFANTCVCEARDLFNFGCKCGYVTPRKWGL